LQGWAINLARGPLSVGCI